MRLAHLELLNFKNYSTLKVEMGAKINLIYGNNGSGKTNLLDAIYFLGISKSYFSMSDKHLVKEGDDLFRVAGRFRQDDQSSFDIVVKYRLGASKSIEYKKNKLKSASELVGVVPIVFVAPDDSKLVNQGSIERRRFVDRILCQSDKVYLSNLMAYNRILIQKNALLKGQYRPDRILYKSYNVKLAEYGAYISSKRRAFVLTYLPSLMDIYQEISNGVESIHLDYESQLMNIDATEGFESVVEDEIRYKRVLFGVQKDDFIFSINDKPLKKYGSQGQIKSYLYSLRIAEFKYLESELKKKPMLILDDYFEKLDSGRLSALIRLINNGTFDQIFLSDTEYERSKILFDENGINFSAFEINNGQLISQQE